MDLIGIIEDAMYRIEDTVPKSELRNRLLSKLKDALAYANQIEYGHTSTPPADKKVCLCTLDGTTGDVMAYDKDCPVHMARLAI